MELMTNASKNECHRCGRQFARLEHLQRHERSHTKEKPFGCLICTKAFTRKDLLKRHNRIYHDHNSAQDQSFGVTVGRNTSDQVAGASLTQTSSRGPNSQPPDIVRNGTVSFQDPDACAFAVSYDRNTSFLDQPVLTAEQAALQSEQNLNDATTWAPGFEYPDFSICYVGDEFSNFVDSIGFPSNPFDPAYQPVPDWPSEPVSSSHVDISNSPRIRLDAADTAEELTGEATPWASRMPSAQPSEQQGDRSNYSKRDVPNDVAQVTHDCREDMIEKLKVYSAIIPSNFKMPSRHTLTCFMTGYATIFNEHYPLLHLPTLKLKALPIDLILSIAALGAQYYWERAKGLDLFHLARAITYERLRGQSPSSRQTGLKDHEMLQAAQTLLLLIAVSTWSEAGKGEAFSLRSLLEEVMHAEAFSLQSPTKADSWIHWKHYEEVKRVKLIAYCFFNLHTLTFDVPPMMLYRDLNVALACTENLWRADSSEKWRKAMAIEKPGIPFADAFRTLFKRPSVGTTNSGIYSPLSGHALLQAIIQHIWLLQQAGNLPVRHSVASTEAASSVELALKRWRDTWETEKDSSGGGPHSDGPMPFTSRALLRLAYIRINIDSGSSRSIATWNPQLIAHSLCRHEPVQRNDKMTRAALHCAQGLGIPIKLGINFVAHTQVFYWSNQYALCSLECALLLTKWLEAVVVPNPVPALTEKEQKLLNFVVQLVNHTEYEASREKLLQNNKHLSIIVLRLWAKLFRDTSVWEIVDLIGKSLLAYADLLEGGENGVASVL